MNILNPQNQLLEQFKQEERDKRGGNLPYQQRRFVALYDGTNVEFLSEKLGIRVETLKAWAKHPKIIDAIDKRDSLEDGPIIASRVERKEFWTHIMFSEGVDMKDKLKASELLGKSECDFSETRVLKGVGSGTTVIINTGVPRAPDDPDVQIIREEPEISEAEVVTIEDLFK